MPRRLAQQQMTSNDLEWLFPHRVISAIAELFVNVYLVRDCLYRHFSIVGV